MTEADKNLLSEQTFYHGTTRKMWEAAADVESGGLFVPTNLEDALNYADEAAIREACDNEESGLNDIRPDAVIVSLPGEELVKLLDATGKRPSLEIEPDWGWVDGQEGLARHEGRQFEMPGWKESIAACGGLLLSGFIDADKRGFSVNDYAEMQRAIEEETPPSFGI